MKEKILQKLREIIENRIENIETAIENARKSANEESKSSVGDKYETARAMGQLDQEMQAKQLQQAMLDKAVLEKLIFIENPVKIGLGCYIQTNIGNFFMSIGSGMVEVANQKVMAISPQSPIGQMLMSKQVGENFNFREKTVQILSVS